MIKLLNREVLEVLAKKGRIERRFESPSLSKRGLPASEHAMRQAGI